MKRRRTKEVGVPQVSYLKPGRNAGHPLLAHIEKPIYGGNFLAREQGKAVFVPMVLPGEQVRLRIVEEKKGYATAEMEEVLVPSPDRIAPRCQHFGPCGGCHYQHAGYDTQLEIKQAVLRETLSRGGVATPETIGVLAADPWAYRNRIRLAFDSQGRPGYRGRRSHAVVPIAECPIAAPLLVRAALAAGEVIRKSAPDLHPGEIALFTNPAETALLLTLFVAHPPKVRFDDLAIELREHIPELTGAELAIDSDAHPTPRPIAQWGDPALMYPAAGADFRVDHGAFFQVNRWLLDALVNQVTAGHRGTLAWDLFAGVGLFARRLAQSFEKVVAVESSPAATDALAANLSGTSGTAVRSSALEFLRQHRRAERPDLIVVDPPRTGLGPDITALLAEIQSPALTYVSCDPATLARDLRALLAAGYQLESVTLADLFPQTFHLETVAWMRIP